VLLRCCRNIAGNIIVQSKSLFALHGARLLGSLARLTFFLDGRRPRRRQAKTSTKSYPMAEVRLLNAKFKTRAG
jgi:hypothetical protein